MPYCLQSNENVEIKHYDRYVGKPHEFDYLNVQLQLSFVKPDISSERGFVSGEMQFMKEKKYCDRNGTSQLHRLRQANQHCEALR